MGSIGSSTNDEERGSKCIAQWICRGAFGRRQDAGETKRAILLAGEVRNWCQTCLTCAARKSPAQRNKAKLQGIHRGYPLLLVAMDLLGPLPESTNKTSYVLNILQGTV